MTVYGNGRYRDLKRHEQKYFQVDGKDYSCDGIFNYKATDENGSIWLFELEPTCRIVKGYWANPVGSYGHQTSISQLYNSDWMTSLIKLED